MGFDLPDVLGWVAGSDWPEGDEDRMWAIGADWRTAAAEIRDLLDAVATAKYATLAAYPWGEGIEAIAKSLDQLEHGPRSLEEFARILDTVADGADALGTEIEYTKILVISSLAMLAIEIAAAWVFPPTAPAVEAVAVATTRVAIRRLAGRAISEIARETLKLAVAALTRFTMKHVAISTALGAGQDLAIQLGQKAAGHRKEVDWTRLGDTALTAAAAGAIGGPAGDLLGKGAKHLPLPNTRIPNMFRGAAVGAGAGMIGAVGACGVGGVFNGFTWDPRLLTNGAAFGALTGGTKGLRHPTPGVHPLGAPRFDTPDTANLGGPDASTPHPAPEIPTPPAEHQSRPEPAKETEPAPKPTEPVKEQKPQPEQLGLDFDDSHRPPSPLPAPVSAATPAAPQSATGASPHTQLAPSGESRHQPATPKPVERMNSPRPSTPEGGSPPRQSRAGIPDNRFALDEHEYDTTSKIPYTPRDFGLSPIADYAAPDAPDRSFWVPGSDAESPPEPVPVPDPEPAPAPAPRPDPGFPSLPEPGEGDPGPGCEFPPVPEPGLPRPWDGLGVGSLIGELGGVAAEVCRDGDGLVLRVGDAVIGLGEEAVVEWARDGGFVRFAVVVAGVTAFEVRYPGGADGVDMGLFVQDVVRVARGAR
ncbi:hypothetical protein AB0L82_30265 [Nocardia sp. NPDC052001]|uniref:WXG100-like domain-containing protein n=1 Tax=Nocardia sp. NPDC052001 TaxID=3154853 RepID=UPI0034178994